MKLDGLASFVAVAEAGSISAAARRLGLSKSVVSDRLAEVERTLSAPLLHRTTRKLSLTQDGAAFLERAARIVREVEEATADMAQRHGTLAGPLRVSAPVTFGRMHLGPALFLVHHPELELTLELDDRRADAAADSFDAVVRHGTLQDSRLVAWGLAPSRRLLVAVPAYLARARLAAGTATPPRHLLLQPWRGGLAPGRIARRAGRARRRGPACQQRRRHARRSRSGSGLALLPSFIVGDAIRSGALRVIDVGLQAAAESIYMAHPILHARAEGVSLNLLALRAEGLGRRSRQP